MSKIRVRIAPSPSGSLHVGNVRTALFNYLFAKKNDGTYIIRIEDSDAERTVQGGAEKILQDLIWLGIKPDEGFGIGGNLSPYTQSERLSEYKKQTEFLLEKGLVYKCYCTEEELEKARAVALEKDPKNPFKYPGTCRNITNNLNKDYAIRFKTPTEGAIEFEDIVFGKRVFPNKENYDFVIMRSNGRPLYNYCVVLDDNYHQITHVIRGSDHLKNQAQQLMLYKAFGFDLPKFAHLPMLLNEKGGKLSKRDAAVSIAQYREMGYTPASILNYIAKFGWGHKDQELFSMDQLIEYFDLHTCNKHDGKWNAGKFASINYEHLKSSELTSDQTYAELLQPFLSNKGINLSVEQIKPLIPAVRSKYKTMIESAEHLTLLLQETIVVASELVSQFFSPDNRDKLIRLSSFLTTVDDWSDDNLKTSITNWLTSQNLSLKEISQPLRVALSGKTIGLEIFKMLSVVGKEKTLQRLKCG